MTQGIASGSTGKELIFARPQDLPEDWYVVWERLVSDMGREAQALPMSTMMSLLVERIATLYVKLRMEEGSGNSIDWELWKVFHSLWLKMHSEFSTQVHRSSQTPEQRFVASFKAAFNAAVREAGPDMTLRDFMPLLAQALEEFDV